MSGATGLRGERFESGLRVFVPNGGQCVKGAILEQLEYDNSGTAFTLRDERGADRHARSCPIELTWCASGKSGNSYVSKFRANNDVDIIRIFFCSPLLSCHWRTVNVARLSSGIDDAGPAACECAEPLPLEGQIRLALEQCVRRKCVPWKHRLARALCCSPGLEVAPQSEWFLMSALILQRLYSAMTNHRALECSSARGCFQLWRAAMAAAISYTLAWIVISRIPADLRIPEAAEDALLYAQDILVW
jgi:hypothetical protein